MTNASPRQLDQLLSAHIALNLAPGLSGNARRVGGAILGHWNRRTGQCDPSVERIARMLQIGRATVLRATKELCTGPGRLFDKKSHGGHSNRATYAPIWEKLRAIVTAWNALMLTGGRVEKVSEVRPSKSQSCDLVGIRSETQTYRSNQSKKPVGVAHPETAAAKPQRKRATRPAIPGQGWLMLPVTGGNASRGQAATTAAETRIFSAIREQGPAIYAAVCEAATPGMLASAAEAEVKQRGSGAHALLTLVQDTMAETRRTA